MKNVQHAFGDRLRQIRTSKGVSQEDLAEKAGLHRTYISSVERGERNVTIITIKKISEALQIKASELMIDI